MLFTYYQFVLSGGDIGEYHSITVGFAPLFAESFQLVFIYFSVSIINVIVRRKTDGEVILFVVQFYLSDKGKALFRIPSSVPTEITRLFTTKEEK